ncbi:MAG TPA: hypothetical protein DDX33_01570 [Rikenellaceae bacterium]|nr:hypothetical protein [Rikenellaceae bacterium]
MSNPRLILRILSPEETLFDGEVTKVYFPGAYCPFEVLPGHAPIISSLTDGRLLWETADGNSGYVDIRCGLVRVDSEVVTVCVEK